MKSRIKDYLYLIVGALIAALAFNFFLIPNHVTSGGVSGIAMLLHYVIKTPVGIMIVAINLPLFGIGLKELGFNFGIRTVVGTMLLSLFIDTTAFLKPLTTDPLLSCIYGGIMLGIGLGIVFMGRGSTGGTDIAGRLISKHFAISTGMAMFIVDFFVISSISLYYLDIKIALYSLIVLFLSSKCIDLVTEGATNAKAYFIISSETQMIADRIMTEVKRGVTGIHGRGMYLNVDRMILICLVSRYEASLLKRIVKESDKNAFVFVTDVREVMGEGFGLEEKEIDLKSLIKKENALKSIHRVRGIFQKKKDDQQSEL